MTAIRTRIYELEASSRPPCRLGEAGIAGILVTAEGTKKLLDSGSVKVLKRRNNAHGSAPDDSGVRKAQLRASRISAVIA
jgi:hypothetical protein